MKLCVLVFAIVEGICAESKHSSDLVLDSNPNRLCVTCIFKSFDNCITDMSVFKHDEYAVNVCLIKGYSVLFEHFQLVFNLLFTRIL